MAHFYFFFSTLIFHDLLVGDGDFPLSRPRLPRHNASARMAERQELLLSAGGSGNGGRDPTKFWI